MPGTFQLIRPAPLMAQMRSTDGCIYLYRTMRVVGWRPPTKGRWRYLCLVWTCLVFALSTIYMPCGFALSIVNGFASYSFIEFAAIFQISINTLGATVRSLILLLSLGRLQELKSTLDILDEQIQGDADRRRIHKAVAACNYFFLVISIFYMGYWVSMVVTGLINHLPPWGVYTPFFNWRNGPAEFVAQLLFEYIFMGTVVTITLITDTYPIVFLLSLQGHVDLLKDHVNRLRADPGKAEAENYEDLVRCIEYHKLILKCCDLLRPVASRTICIQFLLIGVVLGLTMISTMYSSDIFSRVSSVIFLLALLLQTFPFCYLCDCVANDSAELCHLLAQSRWIDAERRYISSLQIFMQHVQQPITFIGFGIVEISVSSNIKVAKFAFSVVAVIKQMNLFNGYE